MDQEEVIHNIILAEIERKQKEETIALIDALKHGQKEVRLGNKTAALNKSEEEILSIFKKMKEESTDPFYVGIPSAEIDLWIALFQN